MTNGEFLFVFGYFALRAAESRIEVVAMVRAATRPGCATVIQTREWIRGLSTGRLPVHGQPVAEEQAEEEVQP